MVTGPYIDIGDGCWTRFLLMTTKIKLVVTDSLYDKSF